MTEKNGLIQEFKAFISSGDLIMLSIAFILAGLVKAVVDNFIAGVMNPIISAIAGKPDFNQIGFDVGSARVSIGLVITALVNLVITSAVLFAMYKWYQKAQARRGVTIPPPPGPSETELLTEIRDLLRSR